MYSNATDSAKIEIGILNMLLPAFCFCSEERRKKIINYEKLKEQVIEKLCIENLIIKLNEVDKLKLYAMNEDQRKNFNGHVYNIDKKSFAQVMNRKKGNSEDLNNK